jgi:hypothetical protein
MTAVLKYVKVGLGEAFDWIPMGIGDRDIHDDAAD